MPELFLVPSPVTPTEGDDSAQREEALDIRRSFLVEAPAGSGKTGLIIQRYLKLLADPQVEDPAQVLAITFTRKATAELRDRVLAQLEAVAANTPPANAFDELTRPFAEAAQRKSEQLGWSLLDYPRRLNIRTIDSISAEIARSAPILSGAGGALTPVEDGQPLYAAAARRTLLQLGGPDTALNAALELLLEHRDANLADCEGLIAAMLGARDQWGELIPLGADALTESYLEQEVLPQLERALDQAICRGLTRLTKILPAAALSTLCTLAADMGHAEGYNGSASPIAICAGKHQPPEEQTAHLAHWRALIGLLLKKDGDFRNSFNVNHVMFEITKPHKQQLKQVIDQVRDTPGLKDALCAVQCLPPAVYPEEQWRVAKALFRILSHALVELQLVFSARGECDFIEPSLQARATLRRDPTAAFAGSFPLQHLLVDEMQDTSTSQYELIQLLTGHWDGASQTVFLVGDPKQSIYMFRQARVERFLHTMRSEWLGSRDEGLPVTTLRLTANFRTQATLVGAFNEDFGRLFPRESGATADDPELVSYLDAVARRPATGLTRVWHASPIPYAADTAEKTRLRQTAAARAADEVRGVVEAWRSRPLPPGRSEPWRVAVLVRNRSHLLEIVRALKAEPAIPFRAVDIDPLGERQEILDMLALTRALLHPADRTAWLALLRTPWIGLTLADLHAISAGDDPDLRQATLLELIDARGELLSADGIARLEALWAVLAEALPLRGRLRVADWVERTWRAFRPEPYLSAEALANTDRFLALLEELEEPAGTIDLATLAVRLGRLYAAATAVPGAVELMTIHAAKGLEWDAVLVPALERTGAGSRSRLLSWLELDGAPDLLDDSIAPGILAPIQGKGEESRELNQWMRSIDSAREAAERKRLFYVAATRAREELHLFASPVTKKEGGLSVPSASLLCSAWPAAEEHFQVSPAAIFAMPQPEVLERVAAGSVLAFPGRPAPFVERIPLAPHVADPPALPYGASAQRLGPVFDRPEGSFAARAFGNAVHAFLDELTEQRKARSGEELLAEVEVWLPRITLILRAAGLAPTLAGQEARRVQLALRNTLSDPEGQWILAPRARATTERTLLAEGAARLRTDRSFPAGPAPLIEGADCLWIVDYKTATPGGRELESFLAAERDKYAPQLEAYAAAMGGDMAVRLALYYPLIPRLVWWGYDEPLER